RAEVAHQVEHHFPTRRSSDLEEVADGAYEYAEELIWKKDGHVYQLDGGRSVVSTNKENEIHPEEDRLLFYENLVPTDGELKTYRSEEHTSELQSRFVLVCRLL